MPSICEDSSLLVNLILALKHAGNRPCERGYTAKTGRNFIIYNISAGSGDCCDTSDGRSDRSLSSWKSRRKK